MRIRGDSPSGEQTGSRRPSRRWLAAAVVAAAGLMPLTPAAAQVGPRVEVALTAVEHVRESLPLGRAVLDPGRLCRAGISGWTCPEGVAERISELGMVLGSREFNYVCLGGESNCRLLGADVLLRLEDTRILGGTATVVVTVRWRTEERTRPVGRRRSELHLQHRDGIWEVVRETMSVQTGDMSEAEVEDESGRVGTKDRR